MTRLRSAVLLVVVLLAGAVLSGCAGGANGTGDQGYVVGGGVITQLPAAKRKAPGSVSGTTLQGKHVSLSQYAGKVVVINSWASWCADCRVEAADLDKAADELMPKGVVFLGIDAKETSRDNALAFERNAKTPYPSIYDPSGVNLLAFHGTLGVYSTPATLIIDKQGRVAASILGAIPSAETLVDMVADVNK